MKVAFAGDWHGNGFWARDVIAKAAEQGAQLIVHLGDFGYDFTRMYLDMVNAACRRAELELWFIDGNHENFPKLYEWPIGADGRRQLTERVFHLPRGFRGSFFGDDEYWPDTGEHTFLALGGAYSVDRRSRVLGTSWWAEEMITDEEVEKACAGGKVDILLSHDCPAEVPIPGLKETAHMWDRWVLERAAEHRKQLSKVVNAVQPGVVYHGHYHRCYEREVGYPWGVVQVKGLDCDGTRYDANIDIVEFL